MGWAAGGRGPRLHSWNHSQYEGQTSGETHGEQIQSLWMRHVYLAFLGAAYIDSWSSGSPCWVSIGRGVFDWDHSPLHKFLVHLYPRILSLPVEVLYIFGSILIDLWEGTSKVLVGTVHDANNYNYKCLLFSNDPRLKYLIHIGYYDYMILLISIDSIYLRVINFER